ncbi:TetR/AcrR family transcriptional regulator [Variovorax paradoxus]|uniref:TetR/AcrR family transcriptional regulator n=1 Tax=Variovorax paradoxus TaxID=34073 RepID=UPI0021ACB652|nr:TetR/AcrR family transcriptional regulator [Variovorax paradoxus]UVH58693.1 TetR/AcrR family transcriptional regulator [Variovorax paradoxus]
MAAKKTEEAPAPYHHGDLHAALIGATEALLAERGIEGFTLREAARRAGVSAAAPMHHFGSAAGLLTEVAILGFEELTRCLRAGTETGGTDPARRLRGQGMGYVRFALAYPARFQLMFRKDRLTQDLRLQAAGDAAFAELEQAVRDYNGWSSKKTPNRAMQAAALGAWSVVHGFAHLALDEKFGEQAGNACTNDFVEGMLPEILKQFWP